jgi:hypothetical protein
MAIKSVPDVNNSLQLRIRQAVQRDIATEERSTSTREASGRDGPAPTRHWLRYTKDIVEALCAAVVAHVATGYTHALLSIAPVVCAADASVPGLERVALEACGALTSFDWTPPAEFAKFITKSTCRAPNNRSFASHRTALADPHARTQARRRARRTSSTWSAWLRGASGRRRTTRRLRRPTR